MNSNEMTITELLAPWREGGPARMSQWLRAHTDPAEVAELVERLRQLQAAEQGTGNRLRTDSRYDKHYKRVLEESPAIRHRSLFDDWASCRSDWATLAQNPHLPEQYQCELIDRCIDEIENPPEETVERGPQPAIAVLRCLTEQHGTHVAEEQQARLWKLVPDTRVGTDGEDTRPFARWATPAGAAFTALILMGDLPAEQLHHLYEITPAGYPVIEQVLNHPAATPELWKQALDDERNWSTSNLLQAFRVEREAWQVPEVREFLLEYTGWEDRWRLTARTTGRWQRFWARKALEANPEAVVDQIHRGRVLTPDQIGPGEYATALKAASDRDTRARLQRWLQRVQGEQEPPASPEQSV